MSHTVHVLNGKTRFTKSGMAKLGGLLAALPILMQAREQARREFRDLAHFRLCVKTVTS